MKRKVYKIHKTGSLQNVRLEEDQLPFPQPREVTVEVQAIGLNYADIFSIMGLYRAAPKGHFIPGLEYAGEIAQVGNKVQGIKVGDKVMGVTRFGAYSTHLNIDSRYVVPLPNQWSFAEGAGFLVQVLTAYYALVSLGNLQAQQIVLIQSAAGGVGLQANRIAKRLGAFTIGVVGSQTKLGLLHQEGYDAALVRGADFRERVREVLQGRELQLVLEATGGKYFRWSYQLLAPQGRLVTYGAASFTPSGNRPNYAVLLWKYLFRPKIDPLQMPTDNKAVMGFNLIWLYEKADLMHQLIQEIDALALPPPYIGQTYSFNQLPQALSDFRRGQTTGKLVIEV